MSLVLEGVSFLGLGPFSFQVAGGEKVTMQGASGLGKSQLLRAIVDLTPFSGSVQFGDLETTQIPPQQLRKKIGYLPATAAWWHDSIPPHFKEPDKLPLAELAFDSSILTKEMHQLSSGEKQRLGLLRLLENEPDFLLLDEPTASLDPANVGLMEDFIAAYCKKTGAGYLWVSHDPAQAKRMGQRSLQLTKTGVVDL